MAVPLRQMTPVVAPRGGKIHITGMTSPGLTACRRKCNGWRVAPIAGSGDAAIRASVSCEDCEQAMVRAVKAARSAAARVAAKARWEDR